MAQALALSRSIAALVARVSTPSTMAQAALSRSIAALVARANDDGAVQVQLSAIMTVTAGSALLPLCADESVQSR